MINNKYKNIIYIGYEITMAVLSIASIFMIVLDYAKSIDITAYPYNVFDNLILTIFTIDYFGRLIASKNKRKFITGNIWGSSPKCWCKLNSANLSFHKLKHTGFF